MERVVFCWEDGHILAVFPLKRWDNQGNLTCYDGEHSAVSHSYFCGLELVENPSDYLELKTELLSLGYELKVMNEQQPTTLRGVAKNLYLNA